MAISTVKRMCWMKGWVSFSIALCVGLLAPAAWAQDIPRVDARQDPGVVAPASGPKTEPAEPAPPFEELHLEMPGDDDRPASPDLSETSPRFMVTDIAVAGVTLLDAEMLKPRVAAYLGREVSLSELQQLADAIQIEYARRGYVTTQVYIPPQDIANGRVILQVVEGKLGQIEITGNKAFRARVIAWAVGHEPGEPFNIRKLEKALNTSNRVNPFKLRATLKPGEMPGETDLRITVAEPGAIQVSAVANNQGRPFIGLYRGGTEITHRSLTGNNDRLTVQYQGANGTQVGAASYSIPLNRYGTELGVNASFSDVNIDLGIENQPAITGEARNYGVTLSQPLDRNRVWTTDIGFNWRDVTIEFEDDPMSETRIRSLQAGINFDRVDRWGRTFARLQGTLAPQWRAGNDRFWKGEATFTRVLTLPRENLLIVKATGQWTNEPLPPAEQFQIGGAFNVRGYTEGVLLGDRGYTLGVEHRWPVPFLKRLSPKLDERLQGVTFFDLGQVWQDRDSQAFIPGLSNKRERTLLAGAGVGIRAQLTRFLQGYVDLGYGLVNRDLVEPLRVQPTVRVHFGVRSNLFSEDVKPRGTEVTVLKPPRLP